MSTGISFGLGGMSNTPDAFELGDPDPSQVPTDSPITTAIGGNISHFEPVDYWFHGLKPNSLYKIYVFSYRDGAYFNRIGVETTASVTYSAVGDTELYVNDEQGTNSRTLASYADVVPSWFDGRLGVNFQLDPTGDPC